ncbi:S-adenosyl-L-methionine-dependent methyltransferase [Ascobolus immersus RN42]|uniref:S-adenosyl-L-methionine-dependent methyltransferase n=1 Tax=Ascobolus immersus RN42 TaxID=1160509 RepID=A0A3N4IC13_ASCIM|nr:S-adenosyl-L-methionine-dependent methyltransferase [Ascobolus immersus RN42]
MASASTTPAPTTAPTTAPGTPPKATTTGIADTIMADDGPLAVEDGSEEEDWSDEDEEESSDEPGSSDEDAEDSDAFEFSDNGESTHNVIGPSPTPLSTAHLQAHTAAHDADSDYYTGTLSHSLPSALGHLRRASNTTTLFSSVKAFEYENGRRYHSYRSGVYCLPNDETEIERLDLAYALGGRMLDGQLVWGGVPWEEKARIMEGDGGRTSLEVGRDGKETQGVMKEKRRVLDVGTGTGIWAIDFADLYPEATVIGTDLSPIQPTSIPTNLSFEVDDALSEWTHPDSHFDLIHIRNIAGSITDWCLLLSQAYRCLKPNGTIHLSESSAPMPHFPPGAEGDKLKARYPALAKLSDEFIRTSKLAKLHYDDLGNLDSVLQQVGFKDVKCERAFVPFFSSTPIKESTTAEAPPSRPGTATSITPATTFKDGHMPSKILEDPVLPRLLQIQILSLQALEAFSLRLFTNFGGYTKEEVEKVCEDARNELIKGIQNVGKEGKGEDRLGVEVFWFSGRKGRKGKGRSGGLEGIEE